jgi:hypothetical protein
MYARTLSELEVRQWMVHVEGGDPVGPVSLEQIARGIRARRIPAEASVQRVGEVFWSGIFDEPWVIHALKTVS